MAMSVWVALGSYEECAFGVSVEVASQLSVAANRRSLRWSSCLLFFVLRYWCVLVEEVVLIED